MPGKTVDIVTGYIPGSFRVLGFMMILPVLISSIAKVVSLPFVVIGMAIFAARTGVQLNLDKKTYKEYTWILGLRFGKEEPYPGIEYVFLKENKVSQKMSARLASTTVHSEVFDGFIRFSENDKVRVFRGKTKEEVMKKLMDLSAQLNVDVLDYSK